MKVRGVITLPEEVVEEILLRIPPDEPAHLVHAAAVCKAWHRIILSDDDFLRRYRRFHRTPRLQGYICNDSRGPTVRFVPTASIAVSPAVCAPKLNDGSSPRPSALDCRHGRVLIKTGYCSDGLIIWDPITGSQQHLSLPTHSEYPYLLYVYAGAVLCAKDGCDHLDCHSSPFLVVLVGKSSENDDGDDKEDVRIWASVYSSETGAWSDPTTPNVKTNKLIDEIIGPSLLVGDTLYFKTVLEGHINIVEYDLCKHELSVMDLPAVFHPILIKGNDGRLGLATLLHNCIYVWSWQVDNKDPSRGSVQYRVIKLAHTLLPESAQPPYLICMVETTNTVLIRVEDGLFTLDLKSRQVRKIGETETYGHWPILPYVRFYTPK